RRAPGRRTARLGRSPRPEKWLERRTVSENRRGAARPGETPLREEPVGAVDGARQTAQPAPSRVLQEGAPGSSRVPRSHPVTVQHLHAAAPAWIDSRPAHAGSCADEEPCCRRTARIDRLNARSGNFPRFDGSPVSLADQGPPRLVDGLDVRSLPLSPEDAFVLSRVDGHAVPGDIAASTGLPEERVVECLQRLRALGAIRNGANAAVASMQAPAAEAAASTPRTNSSVRLRPSSGDGNADAPRATLSAEDLALLKEPGDLDEDRRRLILEYFNALERHTHYSILGVGEDATKAEIKAAYYDLVGSFHPDRYFGKELGSFKSRLEKVFGALTKAYDVLTRRRSREEYDRYLAARRTTAGLSGSAPPVRVTPIPVPGLSTPAPAPRPRSATSSAPAPSSAPLSPPPTVRSAPLPPLTTSLPP